MGQGNTNLLGDALKGANKTIDTGTYGEVIQAVSDAQIQKAYEFGAAGFSKDYVVQRLGNSEQIINSYNKRVRHDLMGSGSRSEAFK